MISSFSRSLFCFLWEQRRKASLSRLQRKELPESAGPTLIPGSGCYPQSHSRFVTQPGSESGCLDSPSSALLLRFTQLTTKDGFLKLSGWTSFNKTLCSLYPVVLTTSSATSPLPVLPTLIPQYGIKHKYTNTQFNRLHPDLVLTTAVIKKK